MSVCKRGFSVRFASGLDSMSPARAGAPPAMLRGCMTGFPKKTGVPGLRRDGRGGYNLHSPPAVIHQPRAGCICLV